MFTTAVVLLGLAHPAPAQDSRDRARGVLDVLSDVFGGRPILRGYVVQHREATLVLRADDGRVYTVNTAALDPAALGRLKEGRAVAVSLKSPGPDNTSMPIASAIDTTQGRAPKVFRRAEGTVESVDGDRVVFRTRDDMTITLDRARIVGEAPPVSARDTATLVYEQAPQVAGVWIDSREGVQPSASIGSGSWERVHGYVQSLAVGRFTLNADDGRVLTIDTTRVADLLGVAPGDVVSVVGTVADDGDRLIAERIRPDGTGDPAR